MLPRELSSTLLYVKLPYPTIFSGVLKLSLCTIK